MNYFNTIDTLTSIIDAHGFESTLVSYNFPLNITTSTDNNIRTVSDSGVVRQGIANAIGGNKTIVFTTKLYNSDGNLKRFTRSFCVIVTTSPPPIIFPTIFTRQLSDLSEDINTAALVSAKTSLPVVVYMGETVLFDYAQSVITSSSHERVSLPPWVEALDKPITQEALAKSFALGDEMLASALPKWVDGILGEKTVSFSSSVGSFVRFTTPHSLFDTCTLISEKVSEHSVLDRDHDYISSLLYPFNLRDRLATKTSTNIGSSGRGNNSVAATEAYLCPGCPFMDIAHNAHKNDTLYTNVNCPVAIKFFNMHYVNLREFAALTKTSSDPAAMVFIDHLHNYSLADKPLLAVGGIIFLDTIQSADSGKMFKSFSSSALKSNKRHIGALLYPYSCHNIPTLKAKKVAPKKCKCLANGSEPLCILRTGCPALAINDGKATIFPDMCVGCNGCKTPCPYGAI